MPEHGNDVLGTESSGGAHERVVVPDHDLRNAEAIANIDKHERAEIADAMHPTEQDDVLSDVGCGEGTTGMSAGQ